MSKKQITHQQAKRIHQKQTRYQKQVESNQNDSLKEGLVIKRLSRVAVIEEASSKMVRCSIRPEIPSLVAGDRVIWQSEGQQQGVIVSVLPRQSVLERPDYRGTIKPVAANITQVIIVVAPRPELSWTLLDSYLVMTELLNLKTIILFNKTDLDLPGPEGVTRQEQLKARYESLHDRILLVSKHQPDSYDALLQSLNHQTSVFVGQSGVGKSTIIAHLLPESPPIPIGELSEHSNLGRHTTSNSCLYHLPSGGHLIDSPGVREFGLWDMPINDIAQGFCEFRPYLSQCQFRNCNHADAPGCAIIQAVHQGLIHRGRYDSFLKLSLKFSNRQQTKKS